MIVKHYPGSWLHKEFKNGDIRINIHDALNKYYININDKSLYSLTRVRYRQHNVWIGVNKISDNNKIKYNRHKLYSIT